MRRIDYLNDPTAPKANSIVVATSAYVENDDGQNLLVFVGELVLPEHRRLLGARDVAVVGVHVRGEDLEERRFACAVGTGEPVAAPLGEVHRHVLEKTFGPVRLADPHNLNGRHDARLGSREGQCRVGLRMAFAPETDGGGSRGGNARTSDSMIGSACEIACLARISSNGPGNTTTST